MNPVTLLPPTTALLLPLLCFRLTLREQRASAFNGAGQFFILLAPPNPNYPPSLSILGTPWKHERRHSDGVRAAKQSRRGASNGGLILLTHTLTQMLTSLTRFTWEAERRVLSKNSTEGGGEGRERSSTANAAAPHGEQYHCNMWDNDNYQSYLCEPRSHSTCAFHLCLTWDYHVVLYL